MASPQLTTHQGRRCTKVRRAATDAVAAAGNATTAGESPTPIAVQHSSSKKSVYAPTTNTVASAVAVGLVPAASQAPAAQERPHSEAIPTPVAPVHVETPTPLPAAVSREPQAAPAAPSRNEPAAGPAPAPTPINPLVCEIYLAHDLR
jgi:hypothetical protein